MRAFHAIIGINGIVMFDRRHDLTVGGVITTEFVGKEPARFPTLTFDQTAKEADSGFFIAPGLESQRTRPRPQRYFDLRGMRERRGTGRNSYYSFSTFN